MQRAGTILELLDEVFLMQRALVSAITWAWLGVRSLVT
jgi:hypothetical protein